ncbi:MAG TPA: excinuclease ABC subunit UvrA [Bacteroidales bacterium]|nr:excinuclease ABC subunit UvrA [Bacteroidales bacterium]HPT01663.1 excinuclease ABC subunit UvrA [Bacteroidales bacterium]
MEYSDIDQLDPRKYIIIKGARVNNLKNLSVAIPRNTLAVITGLSGSGKSSLAFDTLYADGQRRYIESLSAYARQFMGRMSKPEVDYIRGIAPAIAIEQKVNTRNPRSTVGTSTEIYEYIKLLYARIGKTYSPVSGNLVKRDSVTDVVDFALSLSEGAVVMIFSPLLRKNGRTLKEHLTIIMQQGFSRIVSNGEIIKIEDILDNPKNLAEESLQLLIDRFTIDFSDADLPARIADSVQTAFYEGNGACSVRYSVEGNVNTREFSNRFELDGITFEEPSLHLFSFNNPYGACKTCEGFGSIIGIDEDLVVPDKSLSIYDDAIACWKGEKMSEWKHELIRNAHHFDFPVHTPYYNLSEEQRELLWTGNRYFGGIRDFFAMVESNTYKIQYRVMLARYRGKTVCPECRGTRLRKDANFVKINGKSVTELVLMPVSESLNFFENLELSEYEKSVAGRILVEIKQRLRFLNNVGLPYLTLNRLSNTLSGGESQRINLATSLGSSLVGSMYILDEPSIGLHPRDTHLLIGVLKGLRDLGNTVIVVEHEEEIIKAADQVIDIGPLAGNHGGELIFQGSYDEITHFENSLTGKYLSGKLKIEIPASRRQWHDFIELRGVRENNLKNINARFPLKVITVITGVSGSGKTSLVKRVLFPALKKIYGGYGERTGKFDRLEGDYSRIAAVELIDQNPIGRSSRSNPATYVKAFDDIRTLFADQPLAKTRGYKPGYFSFNIEGGRCEECEGEGIVTVEMQFMADIHLTCDACKGKRYKDEALDIKFDGLSIADILDLTIEQAVEFFERHSAKNHTCQRIAAKLKPLADVGLGYLELGQSSDTFSGGEAQRIKLASFLTKGESDVPTLFIFDEPTTGLHFHDIHKLLIALNALVAKGHTVIVIEHNPEIIKSADWVIDLGPEGGDKGGYILFEGTPEQLACCEKSYTGKFLKPKLV